MTDDRPSAAIQRIRQAAASAARSVGYCWKIHPGARQECLLRRGHDQPPPAGGATRSASWGTPTVVRPRESE